jgi:subtilisin family serine protease
MVEKKQYRLEYSVVTRLACYATSRYAIGRTLTQERRKTNSMQPPIHKGIHSLVALIAMALSLVGCGGGGSGGGSSSSSGSTATSEPSMSVNVMGDGTTSQASYQIAATGTGLSYSIIKPSPKQGTASVSVTGLVTYTASNAPTSASDTVVVNVSSGSTSSNTTISVKLQYDPLLAYQWHVKNTGQSAFASTAGAAGFDVNASGAWNAGYSGTGVLVNVVDSGLEIAHEDLSARVKPGGSFNFLDNSNNPTATAQNAIDGDHGTSVAGIIAAAAFNGVGGRGIAYGASLIGYNYLKSNQTADQATTSFGGGANGSASSADIFNASYGTNSCTWYSPSNTYDSIYQSTTNLRSGKGAVFVKSAGNGFGSCEQNQKETTCVSNGISCDNANSDPVNSNYNLVVVGALNASGVKSSYSSTGSNIWVAGIGGEYGYNASYAPGYGTGSDAYKPALVTTDVSGCGAGYDKSSPYTSFHITTTGDQKTYNPSCNYTSTFNGTSSAAPSVSGVVALMLQARPDLSYRDVKYVLAKTARQVDSSKAAITASFAGTSFQLESPWTTNGAEFKFHNWYGFGLVDANAAVSLAKTHTLLGAASEEKVTTTTPTTVIFPGSTGSSFTFNPTASKKVEEVIVNLTVNTSSVSSFKTWCAHIELTSPSNTKSILMNGYAGKVSPPSGSEIRMLSNAFYGEGASGIWTMNIYNGCSGPVMVMELSGTVRPTLTLREH